ncbi:hypothetical protein SprV_0602134500 [Sparganum proliferum]
MSTKSDYEQVVEACLRLVQDRIARRHTFYEFPKDNIDARVFQSGFLCSRTPTDAASSRTPLRLDELASFSVHYPTENSVNWRLSAASLHHIPRAFPDAAKTALFGVCIPLTGPHDASAVSLDVTMEPSLPASLWRSIVITLPLTKTLYLVAITSNNLLEMVASHSNSDKLLLHLAINYRCAVDGAERVLLPCPLILSLPQFVMGAYDPPLREAGADTMLRWTAIAGAVNPRMLSLRPTTSARHSPSFGPALQLLLHDHEAGRPRSFQRWAWVSRGFLTGCCIRVHEGDDHPLLQLLVPPKLLPFATKCLLSENFSEQTGLCLSKCEPKVVSRAKDLKPQLHHVLLALLEEVRRTADLLKTVIGEIMRERVPLTTDITPLVNTLTAADTLSDWRARATANDLNWALLKATLLKEKGRLAQLACARQRSDALMRRFCLG